MGCNWPIVRLGDHCRKIGSGATPRGGKSTYLKAGSFTLIRSQNVYNDHFSPGGLAYISEEQARALDGVAVEANDILVNITGDSVARVCLAPSWVLPARVNQHVTIIRPENTSFDSRFLRYQLVSPFQQARLLGLAAIGATRNALTKGMLESFDLPMPPLQIQQQVAETLAALDDRIYLLRQTNITLEAIAQAMFKSWFVDFDPVHAKAERREPEAMVAAIAALFPSKFERSELGLIPKGWLSSAVYDLARFINGAAYKAFDPNREKRGLPIIKIAELKAGVTDQTAYSDMEMPDRYRIGTGDILFSWSGNPDTSIDTFVWPSDSAWLNQHIFRVLPNSSGERSFVLLALKYLRPVFAEIARDKQTTGLGHVTVADLKRLRIAKPDEAVLEQWSLLVDPLVERAFAVQRQAQTLVDLRDTLLPRLICGKLRLPQIERSCGGVAA